MPVYLVLTTLVLSISASTLTKGGVEDFGEQLNCMVDYLDERDRNVIDIYVEIQLSSEYPKQQFRS